MNAEGQGGREKLLDVFGTEKPFLEVNMALSIRPLLTSKEVAKILGVTSEHLANDRYKARHGGTKPLIPYILIGERTVRYRPEDVESYLSSMRVGL